MVVNPADIATKQKEKVQKEDKRDSRKIARELRKGELEGIYIPSIENIEDRSLVRMRDMLVKDCTRYKQRIKSFLYFHGIMIPLEYTKNKGVWSKPFIIWLKTIQLHYSSGKESLSILIEESESLRGRVLEVTKKIRLLSQSEVYQKNYKLLQSIPGIGLVTGMTILTELEKIERFSGNDKLCSYIGLIPSMHSSGERNSHGDITFRSNHHLRSMLVESAWVAVRNDPALMRSYHEYCKRMEPNKAIIRITRKLVNRIQFVLKNQQEYRKLTY